MVRRNKIVVLLGVVLISSLHLLVKGAEPLLIKPATSGESITLFTDRSVYVISEELHYSLFYKQPPQTEGNSWSTVIYVELIKWDGTKLAQSKVPVRQGAANGMIVLPSNIPSGNYYLRAYTKWMRNYSPYSYRYLPVKIVNPYISDIDQGPGEDKTLAKKYASGGIKDLVNVKTTLIEDLEFSDIAERYGKRDRVDLGIQVSDKLKSGRYCLSVAKMDSGLDSDYGGGFELKTKNEALNETDVPEEIEFLPEINGLTLSGKILNPVSGEPVKGSKVYLSSYACAFLLSTATSDENGSFLFTMPYDGESCELHVSEAEASKAQNEILMTSEYCNRAVFLPYIPFDLIDGEKSVVKDMFLNSQLKEKYPELFSEKPVGKDSLSAYYGSLATVVNVKDYIELSNLQEFFYEIIQNVSIRYTDKKPHLVVTGKYCLDFYPPLVLMDNIPVPNDEKLLKVPNSRIDRIEVINRAYIIGDMRYSGVISIFSKNQDMAGLTLEEDGHYFNYELFEKSVAAFPDYASDSVMPSIPDRRNLLYWEPDVALTPGKTSQITFYTSDAPGTYVIRLRGIVGENETPVYNQAVFTVE